MNYVVGHKNPDTDSVVSAIAYANFKGNDFVPAILGELNNETKFVLEKFNIEKPVLLNSINENDNFVLVDHNEKTQTIENISDSQIIEILDHHKFNVSFASPIFITTKPYGSTASLITEKFLEQNKEIDYKIAGLLLSAILSDTVIFKSPTTTDKDKEFAKILSKICDINDINGFGVELFKKKAEIFSKTPSEIILNDFKDFDFGGKKIGVGQIELVEANNLINKKNEILLEMQKMQNDNFYFALILVVTDIMKEGSYLWVVGNKEPIYNIFNITDENNYKEGFLSRKKQVIPPLENGL